MAPSLSAEDAVRIESGAARKNSVFRGFLVPRALRARARKRAARRSAWQPGHNWVLFERFLFARARFFYPTQLPAIPLDRACVCALVCDRGRCWFEGGHHHLFPYSEVLRV